MPKRDDDQEEDVVSDRVDDAVITDAHAVRVPTTKWSR